MINHSKKIVNDVPKMVNKAIHMEMTVKVTCADSVIITRKSVINQ